MDKTRGLGPISTRLRRIAELAGRRRGEALSTLAHHIDVAFLREAYRRTRKDGAVGVDQETASEFERDLTGRLEDLHERFKSGRYKAPPVRRVYIPKGNGGRRPLGIPTLEDKVLQRAVVMVLEAVYEQDFLSCSYGFRPGRSAHDALADLRKGMMAMGGGWVLDADIRGFFDTCPSARFSGQAGARWSDPPRDWEMAEGGGPGGWQREAVDDGDPAGRSDIAAIGEHLPARGTGHVVRRGSTAPDAWTVFSRAIRGRLRDGLREGGRCEASAGGASEAIWEVRS